MTDTSHGFAIDLEVTHFNPEVLEALFGPAITATPAPQRVEFTQTVSGLPTPTPFRPRWWHPFTLARWRANRAHARRVAEWEAEGRPDRLIRTIIPAATLTVEDLDQCRVVFAVSPEPDTAHGASL